MAIRNWSFVIIAGAVALTGCSKSPKEMCQDVEKHAADVLVLSSVPADINPDVLKQKKVEAREVLLQQVGECIPRITSKSYTCMMAAKTKYALEQCDKQ